MELSKFEERRLLFLHIPKTGGMTIHQLLAANYSPDQICTKRPFPLRSQSIAELQKYSLFSGHFSIEEISPKLEPYKIISILREPKARLLSQYYFWRSHSWKHIEEMSYDEVSLSKELDMLQFLKLQKAGSQFDNFMTHALIKRPVTGLPSRQAIENEMVYEACNGLESLTSFGLTEYMNSSVDLIFSDLGMNVPKIIPRINETLTNHLHFRDLEPVEEEIITEDIESELLRLTRMDSQVYAHAKAIFFDRILKRNERRLVDEGHFGNATILEINNLKEERDNMVLERDYARRYPWKFIKYAIKCRQTH